MRFQAGNENLILHFEVYDYHAFLATLILRKEHCASVGITNEKVFRNADNPNDVVILADVTDVAMARKWLEFDELKLIMENAGIKGLPSIRLAD